MLITEIIAKKRDSRELSDQEIAFVVDGISNGSLPDYQLASWAMAVLCRGMSSRETATLTDCMLGSGRRLQRATDRPRVDKHSTGGLGDKVSLILAPLIALFDVDVPMLSGRGLGITGGTLDKLEAFQGYRTDLSEAEVDHQLKSIGCVITGTTQDVAPADKRLYLLRDATATVPSIALITGSIMSKKLAASLDALVLDVKFGSGAFMTNRNDANQLAESLVATGRRMDVKTSAILSDMEQPLGEMVGNACEVNESIEILRGAGPCDARDLTIALCAELLVQIGRFKEISEADAALQARLADGSALKRFQEMVEMQGGTFADALPLADAYVVEAEKTGFIQSTDGATLGNCVISLGGGRKQLGDPVLHDVGLKMHKKIGDEVGTGEQLITVFARSKNDFEAVQTRLRDAIKISSSPVAPNRLFERVAS